VIEENKLPEGWEWTTIGTITAINPRLDISLMLESTSVSFIPMAAVEAGTGCVDTSAQRQLKEVKKGYTAFRENDVLFAKITPCMENGKSAVVRSLSSGIGFGCTEFHVLRMSACIDPQLLYYYVSQEVFRQNARAHMTGTAGQLRVPPAFLADAPFPLAPLLEQHRIVTAIEQQFTRLDAAVTALQHARTKLKRYRAAVLKAAVEGKLTEAWRAEHPTPEPVSALLERILTERRAKWEADMRAKGKDPAKVKYVEPARPDVESLPSVPEGWCWATVEQVCERIVDCLHSTPRFQESGFLCVDTNCIKPGRIVYEKVRYVDEATFMDRNIRMKPQENDVLFSREGALLGVALTVPPKIEMCLGQRMMVFRLNSCIEAKYYEHVLNSAIFRAQYASEITGTASPHLNIRDTCTFVIPLSSLAEQQQIVAEVEQRLSIVTQLEATVNANLKRVERLRQSILKEAFAGRLVPQDPSDEPASMLLERIHKEREGQKPGPSKKPGELKTISVPRMPDVEPIAIDTSEMEQMHLWASTGSRE
jgi:type I restriction enzyme, S subunit